MDGFSVEEFFGSSFSVIKLPERLGEQSQYILHQSQYVGPGTQSILDRLGFFLPSLRADLQNVHQIVIACKGSRRLPGPHYDWLVSWLAEMVQTNTYKLTLISFDRNSKEAAPISEGSDLRWSNGYFDHNLLLPLQPWCILKIFSCLPQEVSRLRSNFDSIMLSEGNNMFKESWITHV